MTINDTVASSSCLLPLGSLGTVTGTVVQYVRRQYHVPTAGTTSHLFGKRTLLFLTLVDRRLLASRLNLLTPSPFQYNKSHPAWERSVARLCYSSLWQGRLVLSGKIAVKLCDQSASNLLEQQFSSVVDSTLMSCHLSHTWIYSFYQKIARHTQHLRWAEPLSLFLSIRNHPLSLESRTCTSRTTMTIMYQ